MTEYLKYKIYHLHLDGMKTNHIAKSQNVSTSTVCNIIKQLSKTHIIYKSNKHAEPHCNETDNDCDFIMPTIKRNQLKKQSFYSKYKEFIKSWF